MYLRLTILFGLVLALSLNVTAYGCVENIFPENGRPPLELVHQTCPDLKNKNASVESSENSIDDHQCLFSIQIMVQNDSFWFHPAPIQSKQHYENKSFLSKDNELEKRPPKA